MLRRYGKLFSVAVFRQIPVLQNLILNNGFFGIGNKLPACVSQGDSFIRSLKNQNSEFIFQLANTGRKSRL